MEESNRIKEQRRMEGRDEALNPSSEAMETGRSEDSKKAVRNNMGTYDEFGSKKASSGSSSEHEKEYMTLTDRKKNQDAKERENDNERIASDRSAEGRRSTETKKHGDKDKDDLKKRDKQWGE